MSAVSAAGKAMPTSNGFESTQNASRTITANEGKPMVTLSNNDALPSSPSAPSSGGLSSFPNKFIRTLSNNPLTDAGRRDSQSQAGTAVAHDPLTQAIMERMSGEHTPVGSRHKSQISDAGTIMPAGDGNARLPPPAPSPTIRSSPSASSRPSLDDRKNPPQPGFGSETGSATASPIGGAGKDKKRNSFFSRLRAPRSKRDSFLLPVADEREPDDPDYDAGRDEGFDAAVFSQPMGYIPRHPEPPKYIKVRARGKKGLERGFDRLFLAQELRARTGKEIAQAGGHRITMNMDGKGGVAGRKREDNACWAMEFSKDGRYLAAGGAGFIVRCWKVIASEQDRIEDEREATANGNSDGVRLSAPVFREKPIREYEGHTATVLALSWSKNNFLLSSSMDKTVRLWHVSREECLCVFKHQDVVPAVQFHPRDDRFFLAGSLDYKLRLWSIPDKNVAYSSQINELVTAVEFTPDGKTAMAGTLSGLCVFYQTEGLKEQTRMHVRSAHGKNAKGSKITGIQAINYPPTDPQGEVKLLITSNDSRIRVYNFRDKSLELKIKGNENATSQIRASFSEDAKYIISGSEDKKAYIWDMKGTPDRSDKEKHPMEVFEAHRDVVTAAVMAPAKTRQLLQASGDPLYEICNPPPVQLVSLGDRPNRNGHIQAPSISSAGGDSVGPVLEGPQTPAESPAFVARSSHPAGHIIVTADNEGRIKCFRADCAYKNRMKKYDSGTFGKKMLKRSGSIATRNSIQSSRHSIQSTQTGNSVAGGFGLDRITSWRASIDRGSGSMTSLQAGQSKSQQSTPTLGNPEGSALGRSSSLKLRKNERSASPRMSISNLSNTFNIGGNSPRRMSSYTSHRSSYTGSIHQNGNVFAGYNYSQNNSSAIHGGGNGASQGLQHPHSTSAATAPARSATSFHSTDSGTHLVARASNEGLGHGIRRIHTRDIDGQRLGLGIGEIEGRGHGGTANSSLSGGETSMTNNSGDASRVPSQVSLLSSEGEGWHDGKEEGSRSASWVGGDEAGHEEQERCRRCRGESFRMMNRSKAGGGVRKRLECSSCGLAVE